MSNDDQVNGGSWLGNTEGLRRRSTRRLRSSVALTPADLLEARLATSRGAPFSTSKIAAGWKARRGGSSGASHDCAVAKAHDARTAGPAGRVVDCFPCLKGT
jgi:hypothetical protein